MHKSTHYNVGDLLECYTTMWAQQQALLYELQDES